MKINVLIKLLDVSVKINDIAVLYVTEIFDNVKLNITPLLKAVPYAKFPVGLLTTE